MMLSSRSHEWFGVGMVATGAFSLPLLAGIGWTLGCALARAGLEWLT